MPTARTLTVATAALVAALALLTRFAGLGLPGWLAAVTFCVAGWAVLAEAMPRYGVQRFGPADLVTLTRAVLVGAVTALVADTDRGSVWPLVVIAAVALAMDAVDGKVARRTNTASEFGARFDMEVDAFLILVLSVYVSMALGPWVLLIGAMRYAFVAAARALPWLNAPLPPSTARKTVAALQGVLLLLAASDLLPYAGTFAVVATALALLVWSFGRDILWLWRTSRSQTVAVAEMLELVARPEPVAS